MQFVQTALALCVLLCVAAQDPDGARKDSPDRQEQERGAAGARKDSPDEQQQERDAAEGAAYGNCVDDNPNCAMWAQNGECNRNKGFMHVSCKKSCELCTSEAEAISASDAARQRLLKAGALSCVAVIAATLWVAYQRGHLSSFPHGRGSADSDAQRKLRQQRLQRFQGEGGFQGEAPSIAPSQGTRRGLEDSNEASEAGDDEIRPPESLAASWEAWAEAHPGEAPPPHRSRKAAAAAPEPPHSLDESWTAWASAQPSTGDGAAAAGVLAGAAAAAAGRAPAAAPRPPLSEAWSDWDASRPKTTPKTAPKMAPKPAPDSAPRPSTSPTRRPSSDHWSHTFASTADAEAALEQFGVGFAGEGEARVGGVLVLVLEANDPTSLHLVQAVWPDAELQALLRGATTIAMRLQEPAAKDEARYWAGELATGAPHDLPTISP